MHINFDLCVNEGFSSKVGFSLFRITIKIPNNIRYYLD